MTQIMSLNLTLLPQLHTLTRAYTNTQEYTITQMVHISPIPITWTLKALYYKSYLGPFGALHSAFLWPSCPQL